MDGGGRVVEPLTAGTPGGRGTSAAGRAASRRSSRLLRHLFALTSPGSLLRGGRRSSVSVPLARRLPRLTGTALVLGFFAAVGGYGLVANGQYGELKARYGEPRDVLARALGFGLDKVTIAGVARLPETRILQIAGISPRTSLAFLDVADIRERLLAEPFIKSAEVRKLYPRDLAVTIVERQPYALWQLAGELFVIAADGTPIDKLRDPTLVDLPLVVGERANLQAASYVALLDAAGPLRGKIRAGTLVSGRRWTLKMHNGLDIRLPEEGAPAAMARLVRYDREAGLLDKDVLAIDLRLPDRVVVRLTEEAAAARAEASKKKLQRGVKGIET